jgi:acetyl esterase/lipase
LLAAGAALLLGTAVARAEEKLPDDSAPLSPTAKPVATPTSLPGAETHLYRAGSPEPMRLFVFKPAGWSATDQRPALVHFFGGGFVRGGPAQAAGWAKNAAKLGLVGIAADYRVKERFPTDASACVADARAAVHWLQVHAAELGLDPAKIVVSGSSAGGHLALWTAIAHTPPGSDPAEAPLQKPAALILMSPAADTSLVTGQRGERFGREPEKLSPLQNLDPQMPPTLLFHGDADPTVPYAHAVALHAALIKTGNVCEFITMPGGGHGFTLPEWKEKAPKLIADFLARQKLIPAPSP